MGQLNIHLKMSHIELCGTHDWFSLADEAFHLCFHVSWMPCYTVVYIILPAIEELCKSMQIQLPTMKSVPFISWEVYLEQSALIQK